MHPGRSTCNGRVCAREPRRCCCREHAEKDSERQRRPGQDRQTRAPAGRQGRRRDGQIDYERVELAVRAGARTRPRGAPPAPRPAGALRRSPRAAAPRRPRGRCRKRGANTVSPHHQRSAPDAPSINVSQACGPVPGSARSRWRRGRRTEPPVPHDRLATLAIARRRWARYPRSHGSRREPCRGPDLANGHKRASGACSVRASALIEAAVRAGRRCRSQGGDERHRPPDCVPLYRVNAGVNSSGRRPRPRRKPVIQPPSRRLQPLSSASRRAGAVHADWRDAR